MPNQDDKQAKPNSSSNEEDFEKVILPPNKTAGRHKIPLDPEEVERLASEMMTVDEIGAHLGVSGDTIHRNFAARVRRGKLKSCGSLRSKQYKKAMDGDSRMLVWLGKQLLGQSERFSLDPTDPFTGATGYEFVKPPPEIEDGNTIEGELVDATPSEDVQDESTIDECQK